MALTATIYNISVQLADADRAVYETLDLRVARQPSETAEYMTMRVLAYCLEYTEGISFTEGVASGDEPAVLIRDLTGRITGWIEVGMPGAERLHRGSKLADRTAVYTHRELRQVLAQFSGAKIHRSPEIPIYSFERGFVEALAARIDRRTDLALTVTGRHLFADLGGSSLQSAILEQPVG
jgi:uncharacterized protein YaeQ